MPHSPVKLVGILRLRKRFTSFRACCAQDDIFSFKPNSFEAENPTSRKSGIPGCRRMNGEIYSGTISIADTVAYPVTGTNSSSNLPCAFGSRPLTIRTSG